MLLSTEMPGIVLPLTVSITLGLVTVKSLAVTGDWPGAIVNVAVRNSPSGMLGEMFILPIVTLPRVLSTFGMKIPPLLLPDNLISLVVVVTPLLRGKLSVAVIPPINIPEGRVPLVISLTVALVA